MTIANRPRVTIGMPVYNAASLLASALDSLLAQTYANFALVISDNASTDDTEVIGRDYAARDARIRYVRQEVNRGSTSNFNAVFELSDTEFFKWAAYDDLCQPTYLQRCVEVLDQNSDVLWVHSRSRHIDVRGELLLGEETPEISYVNADKNETANDDVDRSHPTRASQRASDRFRSVLLGRDGCLDSYGLIRSAVLRKTGLYVPYFGSEKVLMAELGLWGRYFEIPETLFFARIHPNAAGSQRTSRLQRLFINPRAGQSWRFSRLQLLRAYAAAVRRSKLGFPERARCYAAISHYVFQIHKWKSVVLKTLTGAGLAGEYPSVPAGQKQCAPKGC